MIKIFIATAVALSVLAAAHVTVIASGITSQATQPGQVRVVQEDGVIYLSNEVIHDPETASASSPSRTQRQNSGWGKIGVLETSIFPPEGYAPNLGVWISAVMNLIIVLAALLVLFYLIWGAIEWITSGGNKAKVDAARGKITSAVVGLIIVASSFAIFILMIRFLGFSSTSDLFENITPISEPEARVTPAPSPSASPTPTATASAELEV